MTIPRILALMPLALIASCNDAQPPANSAKASPGYWLANYKLLSYRVNGTAIDTSNIPEEEMRKLNADIGCSAMNLSSKEDISKMMTTYNHATSQCTITSINEVGEEFSFEGSCEMPDVSGMRHKAVFSVSGRQSANEVLVDATGKSILTNQQTGSSTIMDSDMRGTLTRAKDC